MSQYPFNPVATKHIIVKCSSPLCGWTCRMHLLAEAPAKTVFCPRCYQPCREVAAAAGGHVGQTEEKSE